MPAESAERTWNRRPSSDLISRVLTSFVSFSLLQLALYLVPCFFPDSSLLTLLSLSAVATLALAAVGRCCKRLLGLRASAPAFVFLSIVSGWGVYVGVIRQVISPLTNFILNMEFAMLIVGLCSILSRDPGFVMTESSHLKKLVESPVSVFEARPKELVPSTCDMPYEFFAEDTAIPLQRVRYCGHCKAHVKGFDHHCPAFGNCIGQKNRVLFIVLLAGFVFTEASYVASSAQYGSQTQQKLKSWIKLGIGYVTVSLSLASLSINLVFSTMIFSLLQLLWQVVFLAWHIYFVCFNIRTDEWINWKSYPEFHMIVHPEPGHTPSGSEIRFTNPYDKGILSNVKEFLTAVK